MCFSLLRSVATVRDGFSGPETIPPHQGLAQAQNQKPLEADICSHTSIQSDDAAQVASLCCAATRPSRWIRNRSLPEYFPNRSRSISTLAVFTALISPGDQSRVACKTTSKVQVWISRSGYALPIAPIRLLLHSRFRICLPIRLPVTACRCLQHPRVVPRLSVC